MTPTATPADTRRPRRTGRRVVLVALAVCCVLASAGAATAAGPTSGATTTNDAADDGTAARPVDATTVATAATAQSRECFSQDSYVTEAGGLVEISVDCGGYLLVGGDRVVDRPSRTNFFDVVYVPGDGGTFTINTRLLGTDAPAGDVYSGGVVSYAYEPDASVFDDVRFEAENGTEIAEDLAAFRDVLGVTPLPRPIQPERYRLVAGTGGTIVLRDDGIPYPKTPVDRSNLKLTQPAVELDGIETYVAPQGTADANDTLGDFRGSWTARSTVAKGDRVIVGGFETDGYRGALDAISAGGVTSLGESGVGPGLLRELKRIPEGVNVTVEHLNPGPNESPERLDLSGSTADGLYVLFDEDAEEFYLVVDTRRDSALGQALRPGDEYRVEYTLRSTDGERFAFDHDGLSGQPDPFAAVSEASEKDEQYPYFGESERVERVSTTFTIAEPYIEYDYVTRDGALIVSNEGAVSGSTNYAPGTDIGFQLISKDGPPPTVVEIEEPGVGADGTFSRSVPLSELDLGAPLEAELYLRERLYDRRPVVIARDRTDPAFFAVERVEPTVTVVRDRPLSSLTATINNTGVDDDTQEVELQVDGELTFGTREVFLQPGETETLRFDDVLARLSVGEHSYTIRTDDDTASGTLNVTEPPPDPTPTPTRTPTAQPTTVTTAATATPAATTTTAAPTATPPASETSTPVDAGDPTAASLLGRSLVVGVRVRDVLAGAAIVGAVAGLNYLS